MENRDEKQFRELTKGTLKILRDRIDRESPRTGHFRPLGQIFDLPGTENVVEFIFSHLNGDPPRLRTIMLGVVRKGTDRIYQIFLTTGTKEEIMEYLQKDGLMEECREHIRRLSGSVDKYWD